MTLNTLGKSNSFEPQPYAISSGDIIGANSKNSSQNSIYKAQPVGVASSEFTGPPMHLASPFEKSLKESSFNPLRISKLAGAGTGILPWAVLTTPPPTAIGRPTTLSLSIPKSK